jgi:simple sugar transport system ATP-binding protein
MVFQNFTLVPAMTVAENIALFLPHLDFALRTPQIAARIREIGERYGIEIGPGAYVADLDMGQRQRVEVVKVLLGGARILIFDEPTSVLAPHEVDGLFQVFSRLRADGYAILFITHKLPEVMACADAITVLRRGKVVGTLERAGATPKAIVRMMLDGDPPPPAHRDGEATEQGEPALVFRRLSLHDPHTGVGLKDIDLQLFAGEIVGVAGVSGNGQSELSAIALGLRRPDSGEMLVDGKNATHWTTRQWLAAGLACIPEDPLRQGAIPAMTVADNMILGDQYNFTSNAGWVLDRPSALRKAAALLHTTFTAKAPRLHASAETLSGGNLQRVVIARELGRKPKIVLAYYPARGLDVSNAEAMRNLLLQQRREGAAVLLVSEDMDELFALSDRLAVMYHGRIVGVFRPQDVNAEMIGHLMTGSSLEHA